MSLFRSTQRISSPLARRLDQRFLRPSIPVSAIRRRAIGGYGDGNGDPRGGKPQDQGVNQSIDQEHPGPPPVSEGEGTGGGPTKGSSTGHNNSDSSSSDGKSASGSGSGSDSSSGGGVSSSKSGSESGSSSTGGAQPKIHDNSREPDTDTHEVREHNKGVDGRHDRAHNRQGGDEAHKVDKPYWSGSGGTQ